MTDRRRSYGPGPKISLSHYLVVLIRSLCGPYLRRLAPIAQKQQQCLPLELTKATKVDATVIVDLVGKNLSSGDVFRQLVARITYELKGVEEALRTALSSFDDEVGRLQELVGTLTARLEELDDRLQGRCNDMEQYKRRQNLRIFGVEEKTGEYTARFCFVCVCGWSDHNVTAASIAGRSLPVSPLLAARVFDCPAPGQRASPPFLSALLCRSLAPYNKLHGSTRYCMTVPTVLHNLYCLATNPAVQERAYQEVQSVVGMTDDITSAHLDKLNYIKAIVKETFRMYPNGTEISRILQSDLILSNYHLPPQTIININMGVHFRSDKHFSYPNQFRPERWVRGESTESIHPFLLTPFGLGTRTCAGRRFAEQDMYVLLTEIIRRFQLSYEGTQPMKLVYNTLLLPAGPLPIRFIPRKL
ncbi:hypothetical protein J6590_055977 [Homalodisca vitripennis]|nr:hypothetical protein J6590_055977 [Homalodisca vitripennis]